MADSEEKLKNLWSGWKRRVKKASLKLSIKKTKIMASGPIISWQISSVQSLSCVRLSTTPWTTAHQASLSITNSQSLPKSMFIESVMPSNHLILCRPLLLLPSIPPSIRVFFNESTLRIRWPKYWSLSFSISPSNEHPGLISFRTDCLDLLAVQGTLKSLLQHHSSKAAIIWCSAFFIVQLSHPHMTPGKTIAWKIDWGGGMEIVTDFIFLAPKSLWMLTAARNLKTLSPWKKSYDKSRQCIKKQRHHFANKGPYSQSCFFQ